MPPIRERWWLWHGDERGSAAVELTIAAPLLVMLLLLVVAVGRLADARLRIGDAAHQAARAASLARDPATATRDARATARSALSDAGIVCHPMNLTVDTAGFRPGGQVTTTLTCTVGLGDLALIHLPGSKTLTSQATSPIDTFRGVTGSPR